jgi:hypothetical protein
MTVFIFSSEIHKFISICDDFSFSYKLLILELCPCRETFCEFGNPNLSAYMPPDQGSHYCWIKPQIPLSHFRKKKSEYSIKKICRQHPLLFPLILENQRLCERMHMVLLFTIYQTIEYWTSFYQTIQCSHRHWCIRITFLSEWSPCERHQLQHMHF